MNQQSEERKTGAAPSAGASQEPARQTHYQPTAGQPAFAAQPNAGAGYFPHGQPQPQPGPVPQAPCYPVRGPYPPPYCAPVSYQPAPPKQQLRPTTFIGELICLALGILSFFALFYAPAVKLVGIVFGIAGVVILFVTRRREERFSGCGIAGLLICVVSAGLVLYQLLEFLI